MKSALSNPFAAAIFAATLTTSTYAQKTLLTDNFDTETSFTAAPNADQGGELAPASYTTIPRFSTPSYQRRGTGVLELCFDGTTASGDSRVFTAADYVNYANIFNSPIRITFDINAAEVDWVGLVVGTTSAWVDGKSNTTKFSALFKNDGTGAKWVNGTGQGALATDTASLITLELRNTAGNGSPFNGTGSVAQLWRGATDLGAYTLPQLDASNGRFAFCAYNGNLGAGGTFDNFSITATTAAPVVPRWSGAVNGTWDDTTANFSGQSFSDLKTAGATNVLFGDNDSSSNPVATSNVTIAADGVEIADVIFNNASVDYTLACADATGIKGATNLAKIGIGLLTLTGTHSYTGTTTIGGGEVVLSGGNDRLPVTTALTLSNPGVLRLDGNNQKVASLASNGRVVNGSATLATFTVNNSSPATFSGNLGGPGVDEDNLALIKSDTGTLTLRGPSTFTGGTTVNDGILSLGYNSTAQLNTAIGPMTSSNIVTINSGGTLTGTQNNWLGSAISVVINPGGTLRGGSGTITGLGNVTLNGGTIEVASGLNASGWFAAYTLGGDITVSGSTPSSITTASGAGAPANLQMANGNNGVGGTRMLTVNDVTNSADSDLVVSARLADGTLIKNGLGTVEIAAGETGTASPISWEIQEGKFLLAEGATFEFRITASTSNRVIGTPGGSGSATFNGTLNINTSAVTLTTGNLWSLIDVTGLDASFGPNFSIAGFDDSDNDGVWTKTDAVGDWSFSKATGEITLNGGPTAPVITTKNPQDGETRAQIATPIVATFDQNILLASAAATVIYEEDFESGDGGFTTSGVPNNWAWGTPNSDNQVGLVVTTGNGGSANCWATNLGTGGTPPSGTITVGANSILHGPDAVGNGIDLTGVVVAQLQFAAAFDVAAGDVVEVWIRDVGTGNLLATILPFGASPLTSDAAADWATYGPYDISAAAGHSVYLEIRYQGTKENYIGLYIDDLLVTGVDASAAITLRNLSDGIETIIPVNDASQVAVSGNTLTITPAAPLKGGTDYAVRIGAAAVRNFSDLGFAGIDNDTDWNFSTVPFVINNFANGSDAATGISTATTYTHLVDINKGSTTAVINGVTFDNTLANYTLTGPPSNFVNNTNNGADAGSGMRVLLNNFRYGTLNPHVLTVSGLTPNTTYKLRIYVSHWINVKVGFAFDDTVPASVIGGIDRGAGQIVPSSFDYTYTTGPGDTDLVVTVTPEGAGSFHWYGFSNEVIGALPGETFAEWISNPTFGLAPAEQGLNDDPDGDGIPNGVENFFGTNPGTFSQGLVAGTANPGAGTFTFTHPQNATPAGDLTASYTWSKDLANFLADGATDGALTKVDFTTQTDTPSPGITTVTATVTGTTTSNLFVRVNVTQP